jgi:hypothetical protein
MGSKINKFVNAEMQKFNFLRFFFWRERGKTGEEAQGGSTQEVVGETETPQTNLVKAAASIASSSAASAHHSLAHPVASMSMANPASANGMPPHLAAAIATVASQHQTATAAAAAAGPPAMD